MDLAGVRPPVRSPVSGTIPSSTNNTRRRDSNANKPPVDSASSDATADNNDGQASVRPDGDSRDSVTTALTKAQRAVINDFIIDLQNGDETLLNYFKGLPEVAQSSIASNDDPHGGLKD